MLCIAEDAAESLFNGHSHPFRPTTRDSPARHERVRALRGFMLSVILFKGSADFWAQPAGRRVQDLSESHSGKFQFS